VTRVLVTGGTGFVGSHLVDALLERGDQVACTVRRSSSLRWLEGKPVRLVETEFADPAAVDRALEGVEQVYHAAGVIAARTGEEYVRANAGLMRALLGACLRRPDPPRLLYVSSLSAAGPSPAGGAKLETDAPAPISWYGRSKLEAENLLEHSGGDIPWAIARPCAVYGPRDRGLLSVFQMVKYRFQPRIGGGKRLVSLISARDLCAGLTLAMDAPEATGRVYNFAHPQALSMVEMGGLVARALGVRTLEAPIPDSVLRAAAAVAEVPQRLLQKPLPFNRDKANEMCQSGWVCDTSRAAAELGFQAKVGHAEGLAETARWYREQRWL
jgi:nucleoside-diphosphate-sugar epimerase